MQLTEWEFRFGDDTTWRPIAVPGCWEDAGYPKDRPGPGWYRASPHVPDDLGERRLLLRFGAASYACDVYVGGRLRAQHVGAWDPFEVDVTADATPGQPLELLLRVEKPASLSAGPASPPVPGAYPLKSTLSGFLPYVWGHMFGGLWQPVELVAAGPTLITRAEARGTPDGLVQFDIATSRPAQAALTLRGPDGEHLLAEVIDVGEGGAVRSYQLGEPASPWSPDTPALYTAVVQVNGDERVVRFGLRSVAASGDVLLLNGRPVYPRMALSWGWYADRLSPDPGPERVRRDFELLRSLGYNGVKLCLWFPPPYYFELADELGMLLWVELPMWLPDPDERFRRQTPLEYERLVRIASRHPSVLLYSLGCELNRAVGPDILGPLYEMVKRLGGGGLVRDNSGSGEAYGGLLNEFADYYDYHFYCDLQFFRPLLDTFSPRWRPQQPWIFGEFCDYDTFRDLRNLLGHREHREHRDEDPDAARAHATAAEAQHGAAVSPSESSVTSVAESPWWVSADPAVNPQGARWQMDVPHHPERLAANGYLARAAELERLSYHHALLHRKATLEVVRAYREITGYVITGEVDTPISTAGMWDDAGRLKFEPAAFRAFNQDTVLALGWDKRRDWVNGGDRAAPWDTFGYAAGATLRAHIIASHYGLSTGAAALAWSVAFEDEPPFAQGDALTPFVLAPGDVREVALAELRAPDVAAPRQITLRAHLRIGEDESENAWPLWVFPRGAWDGLRDVALLDPPGRLDGLQRLAPGIATVDSAALELDRRPQTAGDSGGAVAPGSNDPWSVVRGPWSVVIATAWTAALDAFVRAGGRALLIQDPSGPPGPLAALPMPFWREALRLCEPHPAWGDFPHQGWAGLQLYGCASDHALDTEALGERARPILRRIDTRTMRYHDYACELAWGDGRLIVTTLRFQGGHGDQPAGVARNTAAAHLLSCMVRALR